MVSIPTPEISISSKDKQQLSDTTSQDSTSVVQPVYTSLFDSSFVSAISTPTFTPTFSIPSVSSDISAISDTVSTEKTTQSIVSTNQASVSQTSSTVSEAQSVVSTPTISSVPVSSVVPTSSSTVSAIEDPNVSSTLLSVISTPPVSTSVSAVVSEKPSQVVSNTDVLVSTLTTSSTPPASASNPPVSVSTPPVSVSTPDVSVSAPVSNAASTVIAPPSSTSTPVVSSVPIPQISTQETPVSGVASTTLSNIVPSSVATDTNTFPISSIITPSVAASSVQSNTDILQPVSTISTLPNTVSGISSVTTNDVPTQSQITVPSSIPNTLPVTPSSVEAVTSTPTRNTPTFVSISSTATVAAPISDISTGPVSAPVSTQISAPPSQITPDQPKLPTVTPSSISSRTRRASSSTADNWWIPTQLITASTQVTGSAMVSSAATKTLPQVIGAATSVPTPEGYTVITIGFKEALNYEFIVSSPKSSAQIFSFLPYVLNTPFDDIYDNITVSRLVPLQKKDIGYFITVAEVLFPESAIANLSVYIKDTNSSLYTKNDDALRSLALLIDPSIPLTGLVTSANSADTSSSSSSTDSSSSSSKGNSDHKSGSTSEDDDSSSEDMGTLEYSGKSSSNPTGSIKNKKTLVPLVVCTVGGGILYICLMTFIVRFFVRRHRERQVAIKFPDDSSSSSSEFNNEKKDTNRQSITASMKINMWMDHSESNNEGGLYSSDVPAKKSMIKISKPIATQNSLGWNDV